MTFIDIEFCSISIELHSLHFNIIMNGWIVFSLHQLRLVMKQNMAVTSQRTLDVWRVWLLAEVLLLSYFNVST